MRCGRASRETRGARRCPRGSAPGLAASLGQGENVGMSRDAGRHRHCPARRCVRSCTLALFGKRASCNRQGAKNHAAGAVSHHDMSDRAMMGAHRQW